MEASNVKKKKPRKKIRAKALLVMEVSTHPPRNGRGKPFFSLLDLSWSYSNNEELFLLSLMSLGHNLDPFFLLFVHIYHFSFSLLTGRRGYIRILSFWKCLMLTHRILQWPGHQFSLQCRHQTAAKSHGSSLW